MDDLNCLQAQTLGRSWRSNRRRSATQPTSPRASSAVQPDVTLGSADVPPNCACGINLHPLVVLEIQHCCSGELISHLTNGYMHNNGPACSAPDVEVPRSRRGYMYLRISTPTSTTLQGDAHVYTLTALLLHSSEDCGQTVSAKL